MIQIGSNMERKNNMKRMWEWYWGLKWIERICVTFTSCVIIGITACTVTVFAGAINEVNNSPSRPGTGRNITESTANTWARSDDVFECSESKGLAKVWIENDSVYVKSYRFKVVVKDKDGFTVGEGEGENDDLPARDKARDDVGFIFWEDGYSCKVVEQEEKRARS